MHDFPSPDSIEALACEYGELSSRRFLSDDEAARIDEILTLAISNPLLSFYIAECDHILGHELDLLQDQNRRSFENQQALLKEYVGFRNFPVEPVSFSKDAIRQSGYC